MGLKLRTFSTMKIGGEAECTLKLSDLLSSPDKLRNLPRPLRILGNGSNTLIDDQGLKGSVIITRESDIVPEILESSSSSILVKASAGLYLPSLSAWATQHELTGCEFMAVIPGTLGGAVVQNAGAHEQEISEILEAIEVFDFETHTIKRWSREECALTYRHSRLKEDPTLWVVSAILNLQRGDRKTIESRIEQNIAYRKQKTPYSKPSLGSIFTRLKAPNGSWLYPGKLIEDAGLKGHREGGAQVSPIHANYIVNENRATFRDVYKLILFIEGRVFEHSGVRLQREVLIWTDRLPAEVLSDNSAPIR